MLSMLDSDTRRRRDRVDELEEENRQLKQRIAELEGRNDLLGARKAFGFTHVEACMFMLLVRCGAATYEHLHDAGRERFRDLWSDANEAVRSHIKRLRRKLRPHGIEIKTVYGFGYYLCDPYRSRARKLIQQEHA